MDNQDENWERYQTEGLYRCPFFPNANLFSPKWVEAGWKDFLDYTDSTECIPEIQLLCVVDDHIHIIEKPSW